LKDVFGAGTHQTKGKKAMPRRAAAPPPDPILYNRVAHIVSYIASAIPLGTSPLINPNTVIDESDTYGMYDNASVSFGYNRHSAVRIEGH
jgi:hypothetical protein